MSETEVKIRVFSDSHDLVSVTSALKQLELKGFLLSIDFPKEFIIDDNDIIVLQIESLESEFLKNAIKARKELSNRMIVVMRNVDALQVTSLLKLCFFDIFIFPY